MILRSISAATLLAGLMALMAAAQTAPLPQAAGTSQQKPYILQLNTRAVLTDVTVTDKHGNPVLGLRAQDFRIFDNGKPQPLASFDEHRQQTVALDAAPAPGVFSNNFLRHPPPQINAVLFDTTTIHVTDQMYLFQEMKQFVTNLPPGVPVAIFTRWGDVTLQLSQFTDDHAVLMKAIERAIPKFQSSGAWMANEMDSLRQMEVYLSQLPGRKNLIWFTGGSNLMLNVGADLGLGMRAIAAAPDRQAIYDSLESERIAIYPIDARGLTVEWPNPFQQMLMRQDAQATGGQAYMNTNGLALAAQHIVSTDGFYYTLTYSPRDLKNNGNWHRVDVKLDGKGYELNYRRGYFDDDSGQPAPHGKTRTLLTAGGKKAEIPTERGDPILFTARVEPVPPAEAGAPPPKKDMQRYMVRYAIEARDVDSTKAAENVGTAVMGSAVLALNHHGEPVAKRWQKVTLKVDEAKEQALSNASIEFTQTVDLPKGRDYLYLGVWDALTGRMGTVNAEVEVGC